MKKQIGISVAFCLGYIAAAVLGLNGWQTAAGILLCAGGCILGVLFYMESRWILDYRVILSLFWLGGEGIAALQLSNLQQPWNVRTWAAFGLFYLVFLWSWYLGTVLWERGQSRNKTSADRNGSFREGKEKSSEYEQRRAASGNRSAGQNILSATEKKEMTERIYRSIWIVALVSVACFWVEVAILGYIPLFSEDTHAYNYFHVTGIHYFTFSCMLVHPLTLIYLMEAGKPERKRQILLVVWNLLALSIPVLCISKFQFILTLLLPVMIYFLYRKNIPWKKLLIGAGAIGGVSVAIFMFMTSQRNYEDGYLNQIFNMKNPAIPLPFQYVYMYIANNYDNFNCLVEALEGGQAVYAYGFKELFPVFALTGMKFVFPELVNFPVFSTIAELNTLTILYDAYYDFGLAGCVLFGGVLGLVCCFLTKLVESARNPVSYLFYGQVAMYLLLSFFSAWFSNPTTWFWLVITWMLYVYIGGYLKGALPGKRVTDTGSGAGKIEFPEN